MQNASGLDVSIVVFPLLRDVSPPFLRQITRSIYVILSLVPISLPLFFVVSTMLRTVFDKCIFFFLGLINIQNEEGLLLLCGHLSSHKDDLCRQF